MRDPLASNTDPTDEELDELIKSAFAPEKLGLDKLTEKQRQHIREAVEVARDIVGDTHLERLRQAVRDATATIEKDPDNFFIDNVIENDVYLKAAKEKLKELDRADVRAGRKTQEDLFFIPAEFARSLKFEYKP
ncbi:hypothetical protein EDC30_105303 [Paucimonas lemoignei]|uniref:Uncharacterized protein n=1 Tax=Paucimonas lemoignei TaxID=29443 RepID=A0A4V2UIQ3_PAULE|nr:hypothetical protein [Paucimonas lemoignei]TCS37080.1 hypothetical protein EDC30_105303 [Paucimonas lemoignei]